jgi:hypothetical protein
LSESKVHAGLSSLLPRLASVASVLFGGLAGGALWCFVALSVPFDGDFLIVPIGLLLGLFFRWQGLIGRHGLISAVIATTLAFCYAHYLFGAARIARGLGLPLREALSRAQMALVADIAWGNLHAVDALLLILAAAAAAFAATYRKRRLH